ncbi:peptide ABC transporter permease [Mannheimia granulomatis]|uniref:Peptide ABC transporter permease n=1 Tax=Mannheimia granulomatis TaxID=85402 RepID=A0A011P5D1_9PAST|nr:ABC transporter permease subunit [Mannheimia granulomatis]EXI61704.1 peptide ABC transporter permease [Mannheimia granulomatis]RGE48527.1 peptide ABC transporter permease [Mannheimia granulomatis]
MLTALIRKMFLTFITLIVLSIISFHILLRDPLNRLTDMNWFEAYFNYLKGLLAGDFGISFSNGEPLTAQILQVFPATITLCLSALLLSLILGVPLGFFSATQKSNMLGKALNMLGSLSLAVPVFWLALVLMYYASLHQWEIAAIGEMHSIYPKESITGFLLLDIWLSDSPYKLKMIQSALHHLALPTLILAVPATLEIMHVTQARASYVMKQNYIKVAKTRGWTPFRIWTTHILRNTLPSLLPMIARTFILIFAFGMLIETIFSWGGIGRWLINALAIQDYNAISAGVVAIGVFVLSVDMITGFIRVILDPSEKKDWYGAH